MTNHLKHRLRAVREAQGKGLRATARKAEIDPAYLSRIERGLQRPSLPVLLAILRELDLKDPASVIERFWEDPEEWEVPEDGSDD
jgi:transcriptional regulator with XRE-family HTH domain